ncbi:MAG: DUF58 domain-containing protein, partial [Verrucomicrobiales bacterium VVV1]
LAPLDELERSLLLLAASGQETAVFQVLDPAEVTLAFDRPTLFRDLESGREIYIDPAAARSDYVGKLAAHGAAVSAICERLGIACHRLTTDQPLELALYEFLQRRLRRKSTARA